MANNPHFPSDSHPKVDSLVVDVLQKGDYWIQEGKVSRDPAKQMFVFLCLTRVGEEIIRCIIEMRANPYSALVVPGMRATFHGLPFQGDSVSKITLLQAESVSFK